jgi:hypothetical protein
MPDTFMSTSTFSPKNVWRKNQVGADNVDAYIMASGNGTTYFGRVRAGTVIGKLASGLVRPCGVQAATGDDSATNDVTVGDVSGLFTGDVASLYYGQTPETAVAAGDNPSNLTLKPRIRNVKFVLAVAGTSTSYSSAVTYDGTYFTLTVNSATDGGDAATTTVAEVVADLLTNYGWLIETAVAETGADVVQAVSSTLLPFQGDKKASARTLTVNTTTKVCTLSGATFDVTTGDILMLDDGWEPVMISHEDVSTTRLTPEGTIVGRQVPISGGVEGNAKSANLYGVDSVIIPTFFAGGVVDLPFLSDTYLSRFVNIRLH